MRNGSLLAPGVTLLLCVLVGGALPLLLGGGLPSARGGASSLAPTESAQASGEASTPSPLLQLATDTPTPVATATAEATTASSPRPTATATATASPVPSPTPTSTPTATITPTPNAASVAGGRFYVANTQGRGVNLRESPSSVSSSRIVRAWPEETALVATGKVASAEGWTWFNVRDPLGNTGWVPSQLLSTSSGALRTATPASR